MSLLLNGAKSTSASDPPEHVKRAHCRQIYDTLLQYDTKQGSISHGSEQLFVRMSVQDRRFPFSKSLILKKKKNKKKQKHSNTTANQTVWLHLRHSSI